MKAENDVDVERKKHIGKKVIPNKNCTQIIYIQRTELFREIFSSLSILKK